MAKTKLRPTPWALAIAAFDVWRRLPPKQRKQAIRLATKHGPKIAKQVVKTTRRASKSSTKR
jgi:hypothetical protein